MKLSNFVQRTLLCVIGVPAVAALVFLLPHHHFLAFTLLCLFLSLEGSMETDMMLSKTKSIYSYIAWLCPLTEYLFGEGLLLIAVMLLSVLAREIRLGEADDFKSSSDRIIRNIMVVIYPNLFIIYVIKFLKLEVTNSFVLMLFILLIISNEIFSYVFGLLFGKNNAGVFKASPKKSVAGFIGGFISCMGISLLFCHIFSENLPQVPFYLQAVLGAVMCIADNMGDLSESVIKRSTGVKDSGHIIPGRGGVLDCIDGASFCAVVFYFFLSRI